MRLVALLLAFLSLGCFCGDLFGGMKEGFDEGFCSSYPKSFLEGCRSTCDKAKTADECETGCNAALQTDPMYKRCLEK
jgi:hypothetical protein